MKKIFILHGWTYSVDKWEPFVNGLKKEGFTVDLLKIPGLTASLDKPWDLQDYVTWLDSILPKDEKVILLGHSNGGRIAAAFTAKFPERVQNLILIDSAGIFDKRFSVRAKRMIFGSAAKIGKRVFNSPFGKKLLYKAAREHDYETANPIMRATMKNLIRVDSTDDFKKISVPTLIIWGRYDKATPLSAGEKIHELISGSKIFVLDARHSPMFTDVEQTVDIILTELKISSS